MQKPIKTCACKENCALNPDCVIETYLKVDIKSLVNDSVIVSEEIKKTLIMCQSIPLRNAESIEIHIKNCTCY